MKRKHMLLTALFAMMVLTAGMTVSLSGFSTFAKTPKDKEGVVKPSEVMIEKMTKAEENLRGLERTLDRIEESRTITRSENDALDNNGLALAETLSDAFQEASRSTLKAAETEGKEGNVDDLVYFESFETDHVNRVDRIVERSQKIQQGIEDGSIILKDRGEDAVKISKASYSSKNDAGVSPAGSSCATVGGAPGAKILKPCIQPCVNQQWGDCAACLIRNVPQGINYYNQFRSCWDGCRGFWKFFCRAKCLATFVYWIY